MTYKVEDIRKILEEKEEFRFIKLNNNGEEITLSANTIIFSNWIVDAYDTKEFCVGYREYDLYNITPISKIIKII